MRTGGGEEEEQQRRRNPSTRIVGFLDFVHCLTSYKTLKTRRFGSWICFRPQVTQKRVKVEWQPTQLGTLEEKELSQSTGCQRPVHGYQQRCCIGQPNYFTTFSIRQDLAHCTARSFSELPCLFQRGLFSFSAQRPWITSNVWPHTLFAFLVAACTLRHL